MIRCISMHASKGGRRFGACIEKMEATVRIRVCAAPAHGAATLLLPPARYLRIDADLTDPIPLDSYAVAEQLIERGTQAGRTYLAKIDETFLS